MGELELEREVRRGIFHMFLDSSTPTPMESTELLEFGEIRRCQRADHNLYTSSNEERFHVSVHGVDSYVAETNCCARRTRVTQFAEK